MAISGNCTYCGTRIDLPPGATGKKVRCPSCSGVNIIGEEHQGQYVLVGEGGEEPTVIRSEPKAPVPRHKRARRQGARSPASEEGTTPFVLGLLSLLLCQLLGPVAWISGNNHRDRCRARGENPDGLAEAGRIMGIIASLLLVGGCLLGALMVPLAAVAG